MGKNNWTNSELEAAVDTYFQMLALETRGEQLNKSSFTKELLQRHLPTRTSVDHRMQNISYVLHEKGEHWISGYKPLPNFGTGILPSLINYIEKHLSHSTSPLPLYPSPTNVPATRKLPPTGYWIFVCNPSVWDADKWLAQGLDELLFKISKHN